MLLSRLGEKAGLGLIAAALLFGSCLSSAPTDDSNHFAQGPGGAGGPGGQPPQGNPPGPPPGGFGGGNQSVDHGTYANLVRADVADRTYTSSHDTENAVRVQDSSVATLANVVVEKTGGKAGRGDSSNFYGNNAAILVMDKAQATFQNLKVTTAAPGANGLFVYGADTVALVTDAVIRTSQDSSGGIMVAGNGSASVKNADIETQGRSSAALRTDRGGGTLTVDGGTYVSHGVGSPAIYSTAAVTVKNATLTATGSEAVVIEGKNSVSLVNVNATGKMVRPDAENIHNVMIYQSMSGDASPGEGSFNMMGGSLTGLAGDLFYVTNTQAELVLSQVKLTLANEWLLKVVGNDGRTGWGRPGHNGGQLTFSVSDQVLAGRILVDAASSLAFTLQNQSTWTGAVNTSGDAGKVEVTLDATSRWTLDADSHITTFTGDLAQVDAQGHHLWVNGSQVK